MKPAAAGADRPRRQAPGVDLNRQRVDDLLARIGSLGAQLDATAQHAVAALRRARDEPAIEAWDAAAAAPLLELASRIARQQRELDAALERDRARLGLRDAPQAEARPPVADADMDDSAVERARRRQRWTRPDRE